MTGAEKISPKPQAPSRRLPVFSARVTSHTSHVKSPPRGVTLMELLVVMGVFSLTVMLTTAIFMQTNQVQRRVLALTAAQSDVRFALESIVREVRSGRIDYGYYAASGGISIPSPHLVVVDPTGNRLDFSLSRSATVCPPGTTSCLAVSLNGTPAQSVTSRGVNIDQLSFFVSPQSDPFSIDPTTGRYRSNAQPTVTIAFRAKTVSPKPEEAVILNAETTVTARTYAR